MSREGLRGGGGEGREMGVTGRIEGWRNGDGGGGGFSNIYGCPTERRDFTFGG